MTCSRARSTGVRTSKVERSQYAGRSPLGGRLRLVHADPRGRPVVLGQQPAGQRHRLAPVALAEVGAHLHPARVVVRRDRSNTGTVTNDCRRTRPCRCRTRRRCGSGRPAAPSRRRAATTTAPAGRPAERVPTDDCRRARVAAPLRATVATLRRTSTARAPVIQPTSWSLSVSAVGDVGHLAAAVEHDDPVADVHGQRQVVGDQHDRDALLGHPPDQRLHLLGLLVAQRRGRLVEQQHAVARRRRPGSRCGPARRPGAARRRASRPAGSSRRCARRAGRARPRTACAGPCGRRTRASRAGPCAGSRGRC